MCSLKLTILRIVKNNPNSKKIANKKMSEVFQLPLLPQNFRPQNQYKVIHQDLSSQKNQEVPVIAEYAWNWCGFEKIFLQYLGPFWVPFQSLYVQYISSISNISLLCSTLCYFGLFSKTTFVFILKIPMIQFLLNFLSVFCPSSYLDAHLKQNLYKNGAICCLKNWKKSSCSYLTKFRPKT